MAKTTVYAVRAAKSKERVSYRYRDRSDAIAAMKVLQRVSGSELEVYRTTQDLVKVAKRRKGA
jgi:ribosomal protein S8